MAEYRLYGLANLFEGGSTIHCVNGPSHQDRMEATLLRRAGYFPWGTKAWVHRAGEGTVLSQDEALERVLKTERKRCS